MENGIIKLVNLELLEMLCFPTNRMPEMNMRTLVVLLCSVAAFALSMDAPRCTPTDHTQWLASSLKEMETIHVGMTRQDFLKVFKPQSGFFSSTRFKGVYVYRDSQ